MLINLIIFCLILPEIFLCCLHVIGEEKQEGGSLPEVGVFVRELQPSQQNWSGPALARTRHDTRPTYRNE